MAWPFALPVSLLASAIILILHTWTGSCPEIFSDLDHSHQNLCSTLPPPQEYKCPLPQGLRPYSSCCLRYLSHPISLSRSLPKFSGCRSVIPLKNSPFPTLKKWLYFFFLALISSRHIIYFPLVSLHCVPIYIYPHTWIFSDLLDFCSQNVTVKSIIFGSFSWMCLSVGSGQRILCFVFFIFNAWPMVKMW